MSCSKGSSNIEIITPSNGQTFHLGDMIDVKAKIYDSDIIYGETILATSQNGDTLFHYKDPQSIGQSHTLIKSFKATSQGNYKIVISTLGATSNSKSVIVTVN